MKKKIIEVLLILSMFSINVFAVTPGEKIVEILAQYESWFIRIVLKAVLVLLLLIFIYTKLKQKTLKQIIFILILSHFLFISVSSVFLLW